MSYVVVSPLVLVKVHDASGELRAVNYFYAGSVIPELDDEQRDRFLSEGFVKEFGASADESPADDGDESGEEPSTAPKQTAPVAAWVDYAVSKGASREEAEKLTKADLIELYG